MSWAHGTTGIADVCAPSRNPKGPYTFYAAKQFGAWLKAGYAVANTDYEGLGTPGIHPYLVGRSEGRGVVDIVRAARQLDGRLSRRYVIAGHSQGGHAALFAAALAPHWAPDLRLRGVAAFAPASHLGLLSPGAADVHDSQRPVRPCRARPGRACRRLPADPPGADRVRSRARALPADRPQVPR